MIDLYTFGTPNGRKVSIMLEEVGLPYTVHTIDIRQNQQFSPAFVAITPIAKFQPLSIAVRELPYSSRGQF